MYVMELCLLVGTKVLNETNAACTANKPLVRPTVIKKEKSG